MSTPGKKRQLKVYHLIVGFYKDELANESLECNGAIVFFFNSTYQAFEFIESLDNSKVVLFSRRLHSREYLNIAKTTLANNTVISFIRIDSISSLIDKISSLKNKDNKSYYINPAFFTSFESIKKGESYPNWEVVSSDEDLLKQKVRESKVAILFGHGFGVDMQAGPLLLCSLKKHLSHHNTKNNPLLLSCAYGGECERQNSTSLKPNDIASFNWEVIISLTCVGYSASNALYEPTYSVGDAFLERLNATTLITTVRPARFTQDDIDHLYRLVCEELELGEIVLELNRRRLLNNEKIDYICFGNPNIKIKNSNGNLQSKLPNEDKSENKFDRDILKELILIKEGIFILNITLDSISNDIKDIDALFELHSEVRILTNQISFLYKSLSYHKNTNFEDLSVTFNKIGLLSTQIFISWFGLSGNSLINIWNLSFETVQQREGTDCPVCKQKTADIQKLKGIIYSSNRETVICDRCGLVSDSDSHTFFTLRAPDEADQGDTIPMYFKVSSSYKFEIPFHAGVVIKGDNKIVNSSHIEGCLHINECKEVDLSVKLNHCLPGIKIIYVILVIGVNITYYRHPIQIAPVKVGSTKIRGELNP